MPRKRSVGRVFDPVRDFFVKPEYYTDSALLERDARKNFELVVSERLEEGLSWGVLMTVVRDWYQDATAEEKDVDSPYRLWWTIAQEEMDPHKDRKNYRMMQRTTDMVVEEQLRTWKEFESLEDEFCEWGFEEAKKLEKELAPKKADKGKGVARATDKTAVGTDADADRENHEHDVESSSSSSSSVPASDAYDADSSNSDQPLTTLAKKKLALAQHDDVYVDPTRRSYSRRKPNRRLWQ